MKSRNENRTDDQCENECGTPAAMRFCSIACHKEWLARGGKPRPNDLVDINY